MRVCSDGLESTNKISVSGEPVLEGVIADGELLSKYIVLMDSAGSSDYVAPKRVLHDYIDVSKTYGVDGKSIQYGTVGVFNANIINIGKIQHIIIEPIIRAIGNISYTLNTQVISSSENMNRSTKVYLENIVAFTLDSVTAEVEREQLEEIIIDDISNSISS